MKKRNKRKQKHTQRSRPDAVSPLTDAAQQPVPDAVEAPPLPEAAPEAAAAPVEEATEVPAAVPAEAAAEIPAEPVAEEEIPADEAPAEDTAEPVAEEEAISADEAPAEDAAEPVAEEEAISADEAPAEDAAEPVAEEEAISADEAPAEDTAEPVAEEEAIAADEAPAEDTAEPAAEEEAISADEAPAEDAAEPVAENEDIPADKAEPEPLTGETIRLPELPTEAPAAPEDETEEPTRAFPAVAQDPPAQEDNGGSCDDITRVIPVADATVRFSPASPELGDTQPIDREALRELTAVSTDDTQEFTVTPIQPEPETEPFSEDWEPEYDAPIGEYIPPQPIIFQPRSRIQELKQKLVAGPERRYYELMEQGLSGLQAAIFLSGLVLLLACGSLLVYAFDMVPPDRMRLMIFGQVLSMLLATLLGSYQLMGGLASLFRGRVTTDTVLFFTLVACCADSLVCLNTMRVPYCAAYCLEVFLSLMAEYHRRNTEMGQMDTLRRASFLNSVVKVPDYYDNRSGFLRTDGKLEDFMDHYAVPSTPEKALSRYMIVIMIISAVIAALAGVFRGYQVGLQVLTACLLSAMPATGFITLSRPAAVLERKLHRVGAVLCGWDAMKELSQGAAVPLTDQDLFPVGTVKMNGMKFFTDRDPDDTIAAAAALVAAGGGGLGVLFTKVLDSRNGRHYDVTEFRAYPGGGLGGVVNGEPILVGSHGFVSDKGVEIPEGTRVNQALYAAIDGELCGVFAVSYQKCRSSSSGLNSLTSYRNLSPVLTCRDFMLTEEFIRGKFGLNTKKMAFPDQEVRSTLTACQPDEALPGLALLTKTDLNTFAYAITSSRVLRSASILGVTMHIFAGALGLAIVAVLALIGSIGLLAPDHLMLFELLWMIPAFLLTEWTRNI